jgi:phosphatidylglycerol:prolipoprotein diacylglycerol transferase
VLQELFRIPVVDLPVYGYGLMLVIGFLAAAQLAKRLARRCGLNGDLFVNAAILALLAGIVGARLCHIIENFSDFTDPRHSAGENLWRMINLTSGGLTFYGGFLLAFPLLVWYAIRKGIPLRLGMDIVAPCLMVGLGFGRLGCFFNGCCHGAECDSPLAMSFPYHSPPYIEQIGDKANPLVPPAKLVAKRDGDSLVLKGTDQVRRDAELRDLAAHEHSRPVLPTQLFSAFNAFLIAAVCLAFLTVPHGAGRVFALMLILKGISRFILEMIRVEPRQVGPLTLSQALSIVLVALGIAMWLRFGRSTAPIVATRVQPLPGRGAA